MLGVRQLHLSTLSSPVVVNIFLNRFIRSIFVAAYWQHFDYQLKKGLDPALVYSEFLGVIEV